MKKTILAAVLICAIGAPVVVAEEKRVEISFEDQTIVGTLNLPNGAEAPKVALLLPGFMSVRDELPIAGLGRGVFAVLADQLAEQDIASLRIDYRGSGESDGVWEDTAFSTQIADAVAAIDWLATSSDVDGDSISIVGWSQGGLVASHAAATRTEVRSLSLWAPVVQPRVTYSNLLSADLVAKAQAGAVDELHKATLPWGVDTSLKGLFFHELFTTSTAGAVAQYDGPMLVIVGEKDTVVAPQPASGQSLLDYHEGEEKLMVFDTGHVWGAFVGPEMLMDHVMPTTASWIAAHQ